MVRIIVGSVIGFFVGAMVWFPYGIMYAVQSSDTSTLVKVISVLKGVMGL
jgi:hypothetical protein